jgi:hypothetical protein
MIPRRQGSQTWFQIRWNKTLWVGTFEEVEQRHSARRSKAIYQKTLTKAIYQKTLIQMEVLFR